MMLAIIFFVGIFIGGCAVALYFQSQKINRQQQELDEIRKQQNYDF